MTPVVFETCFGWLHSADGDRGVVLCAPYGYEALCTHRGWRDLADTLATAGFPTLRFDYPGTGDSGGDENDPARMEAWLHGIEAAASLLRAATGVSSIVLCGLRLGATLATLAASGIAGVDALVMMAPIMSGRSYVRELRAFGKVAQVPLDAMAGGDVVESAGYRLHAEAAGEIARIDLRRITAAPAPHILVLQAEARRQPELVPHLASLGCKVTEMPFAVHDAFICDALLSRSPEQEAAGIVSWLAALPPALPACAAEPQPPARLALPGATEQPVWFGGDAELFGILCRPELPDPQRPAVVILNTGANHHVGNARMAVELARRLARSGITSLRMDAGGVGDSVLRPGGASKALYTDSSVDDACAAVGFLDAAGHGGAIVVGLCAGAWVGLHAALADRRVIGLVAINLQRFIWRPHMSLQVALRSHKRSSATYLAALRDLASWRQLLRGDVDLLGICQMLGRRFAYRAASRMAGFAAGLMGRESTLHQVRRWMTELAQRRVAVLLLYSEEDPGIDELETFFGPGGARLRRHGTVELETVMQADHSLNSYPARAVVLERLVRFASGCAMHEPAAARSNPIRRRGARPTEGEHVAKAGMAAAP